MQVVKFYPRTIICKVLDGPSKGELEAIPRITLHCSDEYPFTLVLFLHFILSLQFVQVRHQFPLRPCFAMTINKSQGQTFGMVGVDLRTDVFSHGQLYVALSRCRSWDSLRVLLPSTTTDRRVKNVVFKELLDITFIMDGIQHIF